MSVEEDLRKIRARLGVPAYNGVKIKTKSGEIGVIKGADGERLKVYFEGKKGIKT